MGKLIPILEEYSERIGIVSAQIPDPSATALHEFSPQTWGELGKTSFLEDGGDGRNDLIPAPFIIYGVNHLPSAHFCLLPAV